MAQADDGDVFVHPDRRRTAPALAKRDDRPVAHRANKRPRSPSPPFKSRDRHQWDRFSSPDAARHRQSRSPGTHNDRRKSISPDDSRRRRSPSPARPAGPPARRRATGGDNAMEQTRGKRLFGSLLTTLGSAQRNLTSSATQARLAHQQSIQQRGQQRIQEASSRLEQQSRAEAGHRRAARQQIEETFRQKRVDAGLLRTKTEPSVTYLPALFTEEDEKILREQNKQVEEEREAALVAFEAEWQATRAGPTQAMAVDAPVKGESDTLSQDATIGNTAMEAANSADGKDTKNALLSVTPDKQTPILPLESARPGDAMETSGDVTPVVGEPAKSINETSNEKEVPDADARLPDMMKEDPGVDEAVEATESYSDKAAETVMAADLPEAQTTQANVAIENESENEGLSDAGKLEDVEWQGSNAVEDKSPPRRRSTRKKM